VADLVHFDATEREGEHPMTDDHDHRPPDLPATRFGQVKIEDRIVAVLEISQAEQAIADLEGVGVPPEDIWRASRQEMKKIVDRMPANDTTAKSIGRAISGVLSDDKTRVARYLDLAGESWQVLFVRVGDRERDELVRILEANQARDLSYFGRWSVEDLVR
jgi:hypothetical protein